MYQDVIQLFDDCVHSFEVFGQNLSPTSSQQHTTRMPLSQHRTALMGLAMLLVLIYHYGIWVANYLSWLNVGYVGVDVFLLLSAYGLTHSLRQHEASTAQGLSWRKYWQARFWRVWPLFALTGLVTLAVASDAPSTIDAWLGVAGLRVTTLAYYVPHVATPTDWYLSSLPLFYLLVPLLYGCAKRRPWYTLGIALALSIIALVGYWCYAGEPLHWRYQCAVARVPIFVLGMVLAWHKPSGRVYGWAALGAAMLSPMLFEATRFLSHSLLVPLGLPLVLWLLDRLPQKGYQALALMGRHTLAIYCANLVVEALLPYVEGLALRTATCLVGQLVLTLPLVAVAHYLQPHIATHANTHTSTSY